jgi:hypothetical protein
MGIEGIADEIEMPFGYDYYDLPLGKSQRDSSWTQGPPYPFLQTECAGRSMQKFSTPSIDCQKVTNLLASININLHRSYAP